MTIPVQYRADAGRIALIAESYARLLGEPLVTPPSGAASGDGLTQLWADRRVILAHGIEADPLFFFGNRAALAAFETDVAGLLAMPSRLSAEAMLRAERQSLLDRVSRAGFIADYAGVRISARGRRFRIERAVVWNLVDAGGARVGQAACFAAPAHAAPDRAGPDGTEDS